MSFTESEPPTSTPRYSDDELLEILREKVKEDPDVTADEFNSMDDTPAMITYIRRFGSWNEAREKADLGIKCKGDQGTVEIECEYCGVIFDANFSVKDTRKFCSKECQKDDQAEGLGSNGDFSKRNRVKVECENCSQEVLKYRYELDRSEKLFCSRECHLEFRSSNPESYTGDIGPSRRVFCSAEGCDKGFEVANSRYEECDRYYCCRDCYLNEHKKPSGKFLECDAEGCSEEFYVFPSNLDSDNHYCSNECQAEMFMGENNHRWKENCVRYYGRNWYKKRREVRERDNFRCQVCGVHDSDTDMCLDVHHIDRTALENGDPERANRLSNLVLVCRSCHCKVEGWPVVPGFG